MPRFLQPNKSTQHRVAAIALYRALLSRCSSTPLPDDDRVSLRTAIRNKFRRNRNLQSPRLLGLSFKAGYETLDNLDAACAGDTASAGTLSQLATNLSRGLTRPLRPRSFAQPPSEPAKRGACLPPERAVLNVRPYAKTSGPRHVPIMASANGIPFLRLTRPQPHALSRVLNQRLRKRTALFEVKIMIANWWIPLAKQEDEWDSLVNAQARRRVDGNDNVGWIDAFRISEQLNQDAYGRDLAKDRRLVAKMQNIVDSEMKLALQEGQTIVRGRKHKPLWVMKPETAAGQKHRATKA